MKIYWKNFFPSMVSILFWCRLLWNAFFSVKFKMLVLETPVNRSLPFFQGFSFIEPLNYTPKFRSNCGHKLLFKKGFKKYLVIKLESKFYTTKTLKLKFFWKYLPSTMFWQCILGPQQIFNILTLFLFTLKADCNKKWTFSSLVNF